MRRQTGVRVIRGFFEHVPCPLGFTRCPKYVGTQDKCPAQPETESAYALLSRYVMLPSGIKRKLLEIKHTHLAPSAGLDGHADGLHQVALLIILLHRPPRPPSARAHSLR